MTRLFQAEARKARRRGCFDTNSTYEEIAPQSNDGVTFSATELAQLRIDLGALRQPTMSRQVRTGTRGCCC